MRGVARKGSEDEGQETGGDDSCEVSLCGRRPEGSWQWTNRWALFRQNNKHVFGVFSQSFT